GDHRLRRLARIVGHQDEIEIAGRDLAFAEHARLEPADEARPIGAAEHDHRELVDLAGLDERQRLERLVERAEAARKDDERARVLDEHRLPHEKVAKINERIYIRIRALLERQLDVAPDRPAA